MLTRLRSDERLVPVVLVLYGLLEAVRGHSVLQGSRLLMLVSTTLACLALLWRTRRPLTVLLAIVGLLALQPVTGTFVRSGAQVWLVIAGVFACGRYGRGRAAWLAVPVGIAHVLVFFAAMDPVETVASTWTWSLQLFPVFLLGAWLRQQRVLVDRTRAEAAGQARAAAAEERLRVARELHDVLAHSLSVMILQAEAGEAVLATRPARAQEALRQVQATGRAALADTRRLLAVVRGDEINPLHPSAELTEGPGLEAVPTLVQALSDSGHPVHLETQLDSSAVPPHITRTAYRVIQEALTNTLRHAGRVRTTVRLRSTADGLVVEVEDEGKGAAGAVPGGHGLIGMRERVEACHGRLYTGSAARGGFVVRAELPLVPVSRIGADV